MSKKSKKSKKVKPGFTRQGVRDLSTMGKTEIRHRRVEEIPVQPRMPSEGSNRFDSRRFDPRRFANSPVAESPSEGWWEDWY